MRSFVLNNWSPALQAAFGDHWRDHFQPKAQHHPHSEDNSGASSSHVFDSLLPKPSAIIEEIHGEDPQLSTPGVSDHEGTEQDFFMGRGSRIRTFETRSMEVCSIPP